MRCFKRICLPCTSATLTLFFIACAGQPIPAQQDARTADFIGSEWVLSSLGGRPLIAGTRISLEIDSVSLGGYGGCNWYGGFYTATDTALTLGEISSTARACTAPEGVMRQESAFHEALSRSTAYRLTGDRLEMMDAGGDHTLSFLQKEQLAMNPADLVGTEWQLLSMSGLDLVAGSSIGLAFSALEVSGFAGCRGFTGTYAADGDDIRFTSISMTETECGREDALLEQEGRYTTLLSEATDYRLSAQGLEIYTDPGDTLVFSPLVRSRRP